MEKCQKYKLKREIDVETEILSVNVIYENKTG